MKLAWTYGRRDGTAHPIRSAPPLPAQVERSLFDTQRMPGLSADGRAMLRWLRGHPHAPLYRDYSGHRLTRPMQVAAHLRARQVLGGAVDARCPDLARPAWLTRFVREIAARVPAWAHLRRGPPRWEEIATISRADLAGRLAEFVPRDAPVERLLCFSTSGTTGHPLRVPSLPRVAADYFAYHRRALRLFGITPAAGAGQVGIVLAGFQQRCFTYVSVNPLMGECGLAKLNLHPSEWRNADDRWRYLDALAPELVSGDPVSLAELANLPLRHRPRAILSTSMALHAGLRKELETRFGCPVVDIYSMNEVGPLGAFLPEADGFVLLQPRLHVEILGPDGIPVRPGELGEVVVSGGFNPCLPLLRYRTGDYARLGHSRAGPVLRDLQARQPVRFRAPSGRWVNNVEITQALAPWPLRRFTLHQDADGSLCLHIDCNAPLSALAPRLRDALAARFFHEPLPLSIVPLSADDKAKQYTTDLPHACMFTLDRPGPRPASPPGPIA